MSQGSGHRTQLGSPALPRPRAGRRPPPGPDRPARPLTRSLPPQRCTCSHTFGTGNRLTDYPDQIKPLLVRKQAPHRPSDMQRRRGTALLPPKANSHIAPWHGPPLLGSPPLATASYCPGPVTGQEDRDPPRALAPRLPGCPNEAPTGGTGRPKARRQEAGTAMCYVCI